MRRIYINDKLESNIIHLLDYDQFIHLHKVIRLKIHDEVIIFNNEDGEWLAKVDKILNKKIYVRCLHRVSEPKKIPNIDLVFSPIKYQNSETIIRQGTEIGIRNFYPTIFNRTVVNKININKFNSYALGASQQSGRTQIPQIKDLKKIKLQKDLLINKNIMMFDENLEGLDISKIKPQYDKDIIVIIGPEGGFTDFERVLISSFSMNLSNIKIGTRILKADTAIISALTLIFHYFDRD